MCSLNKSRKAEQINLSDQMLKECHFNISDGFYTR